MLSYEQQSNLDEYHVWLWLRAIARLQGLDPSTIGADPEPANAARAA